MVARGDFPQEKLCLALKYISSKAQGKHLVTQMLKSINSQPIRGNVVNANVEWY
jgi:hypothetical protein